MGIKSMLQFLRKKCPEAFKDLPYSFFSGKRVAIDSNNVLIKLMSRAHKEVINQTDVCIHEPDRKLIVERWHEHIKEEIVTFMSFGITPIFVFDGAYIDEKGPTQKKRRDEKAKRVREAEEMKKKVLEMDELERTPQMITDLRKKMHHLGTVSKEEWQNIREILSSLGFPVLQATGEAEKLCAMLCIEGKVSSVLSTDSDLVALGCPLSCSGLAGWIYNPESKKTEMSLKCTFFKPILAALEIEYSTFLDLCIMSGCDFNDNIPRLGVATAYKILKKCESIENLPAKYDDKKEILNHVRGREIFKRENSKDICLGEIVLNLRGISSNQSTNNLNAWIETLAPYYENFPKPSDVYVEKIPSLKTSLVKMKIIGNQIKTEISGAEGLEGAEGVEVLEGVEGAEGLKDAAEKIILKNNHSDSLPNIPKQEPSPVKMKANVISSLAAQQLARFNEKQKGIIKLKILS